PPVFPFGGSVTVPTHVLLPPVPAKLNAVARPDPASWAFASASARITVTPKRHSLGLISIVADLHGICTIAEANISMLSRTGCLVHYKEHRCRFERYGG